MTTATPPAPPDLDPLGDRLRRLAPWADAVPLVHHTAVAIAIDRLAVLLGIAVDVPAEEDR